MRVAAAWLAAVTLLVAAQASGAPATVALGAAGPIPISQEVERQLAATDDGEPTLVMVTGTTTRAAAEASQAAGLRVVEKLNRIGVVAAIGPADAVQAVHAQPGVERVDANPPVELLDDVAHRATGVAQLRATRAYPGFRRLRRDARSPYDGTDISIAVIDGDFDPNHEQFVKNGKSKFDVHLRQACAVHREYVLYLAGSDPSPECGTWLPAQPTDDRPASEGHGTLVAAAAAGYQRTTPSGARSSGVAPGARLVGLSTGAGTANYNVTSALHWVLEYHKDPCGDGSCPPIRVVNNSYGLAADDGVMSHNFDPDSPFGRVTSALVRAGVVVVFAAGNSGGDGSMNNTNYFALNPIPGFVSVGAYWDGNSGDRDATVAGFSSRGHKSDRSTYPDLVAPGATLLLGCRPTSFYCVVSPNDGDAYATVDGTSVSAPYVSGVVAQLLEAKPSLAPADIENVLEDTAYQGFISRALLEPDVFKGRDGKRRGNNDHLTSFHAGHGLVDVVRALSTVLPGSRRANAGVCTSRKPDVRILDRTGDTEQPWQGTATEAGRDIVEVRGSLLRTPGALTVVVRYADLPESEPRMHTTVSVLVDGALAEVDLNRSPTGDAFSVFSGPIEVRGNVDASKDTATFVIRPTKGPIRKNASVFWAWTATGLGFSDADFTEGACPIWVSAPTGR